MAETVENLTVRLLQEMRAEMARGFAEVRSDLIDLRNEVTDLRTSVDGNAVILNFIAGTLSDHETRLEALEETAPEPS